MPLPQPRPGSVWGLVGRLGGPDRLREILTVFYDRLVADPIVGFFFAGKDLGKVVDGQHGFLMRAFQETERFAGIHPSKAHVALPPILRGHFDRRLVVLRDPDAGRGAAGKELCDTVGELLSDPNGLEQTVLVVIATKADKRTAWVKAFKDPAAMLDCAPPKGAKGIASFIVGEARAQKLEIEPGVAEMLAERIGPQLLMLRQELAKVALLAGPGEPIRRAHVEASTSHIAEDSVWDLMDAIGEGRASAALELLARITGSGAPAPVVLGALAAHFRKLSRLRSGGAVPGPPFVVKKLEKQARRYSAKRLVQCLQHIHETDTALKGAGSLSPELALERHDRDEALSGRIAGWNVEWQTLDCLVTR